MPSSASISKSQYLKGLQCPKALWLYRRRPELRPEVSAARQHLFDMGNEIGRLARQCFPHGVEVPEAYYEIDQAIATTRRAVEKGCAALFEAAAGSADGAYSRIDILNKVPGTDDWDLVEVKASTAVKDYHLDDMALQRYAFTGAGYSIRKSILMHVDNTYVRNGALDVHGLFAKEDCTEAVRLRMRKVGTDLQRLLKVLDGPEEPEVAIGDQCGSPFTCDYVDYCWRNIPDYSVYDIFSGGQLDALLSRGIVDVVDIPSDFETTWRQAIEINAVKKGEIYLDASAIDSFLAELVYPLYFLDYETVMPAVPLFNHTRPYQQLPFQFSLHIQGHKGGGLEHIEFLHTATDDPRPGFVEALVESCGNSGSVVVYNRPFESRINNELAESFPAAALRLAAVNHRMVDLLVPFRSRQLYHPDMRGSASLKNVLPALAPELSYEKLAIGDGETASLAYLSCLKDAVTEPEKQAVFHALREYCAQDTLAEVELLKALYRSRA